MLMKTPQPQTPKVALIGAPVDVGASLRGFPEVRSLNTTNGRWDLVAEIEADSLPAFDDVLRRIRQVEGITATETSILLAARK